MKTKKPGCSAYATPIKQKNFETFLRLQFTLLSRILQKCSWAQQRILVIDLTAGAGWNNHGISPDAKNISSPAIIIQLCYYMEIPADIVLCEKDPHTFDLLKNNIDNLITNFNDKYPERANIIKVYYRKTDMNKLLTSKQFQYFVGKKRYGLLYYDPNSVGNPEKTFWGVKQFLETSEAAHLDFLLTWQATGRKRGLGRKNGSLKEYDLGKDLRTCLPFINVKPYIRCLRIHPKDAHQFLLIFMTKWKSHPTIRSNKWKSQMECFDPFMQEGRQKLEEQGININRKK